MIISSDGNASRSFSSSSTKKVSSPKIKKTIPAFFLVFRMPVGLSDDGEAVNRGSIKGQVKGVLERRGQIALPLE